MAAVMPDVLGKHVKIESFVCKTVYLAIFFTTYCKLMCLLL